MSKGLHLSANVREGAVCAVHGGMSGKAVATAYGVDRVTLYRRLWKYDADGAVALQRKGGSGRRRKLEELDENQLRSLLVNGAMHFGYE